MGLFIGLPFYILPLPILGEVYKDTLLRSGQKPQKIQVRLHHSIACVRSVHNYIFQGLGRRNSSWELYVSLLSDGRGNLLIKCPKIR